MKGSGLSGFHTKNIYTPRCIMQTAICICWFQVPISSSSGHPLCYINRTQPSGPQQATLKSAPTHRQNIKSKYYLSEFCLTENWVNVKALTKLFKKKCASSVRTEIFLKGRQKCAQTGEYLSRNKHDQIMPDSIIYVGAIQFSIS